MNYRELIETNDIIKEQYENGISLDKELIEDLDPINHQFDIQVLIDGYNGNVYRMRYFLCSDYNTLRDDYEDKLISGKYIIIKNNVHIILNRIFGKKTKFIIKSKRKGIISLENNKICLNYNQIRITKVLQLLGITNPQELEKLQARIKAELEKSKLEIRTTRDIQKVYNANIIWNEGGTLEQSCMQGKRIENLEQLQERDFVKVVYIHKNRYLRARALLWNVKDEDGNKYKFMDKIYYEDLKYKQMMINYAEENKYLYTFKESSSDVRNYRNTIITRDGKKEEIDMNLIVDGFEVDIERPMPYLDTFKFFHYDKQIANFHILTEDEIYFYAFEDPYLENFVSLTGEMARVPFNNEKIFGKKYGHGWIDYFYRA